MKTKVKVHNSKFKTDANLSFAGCGFLGVYHLGVGICIKKYAPHLFSKKISGASAGALAATCLLCDLPLGQMTSDFFRVVNEARSHSLGPFSPSFNIQHSLIEGLQRFLPEDAHLRVNGRLHISLTRVYDGKNVIVSQFNSREDLLQALLCACFIPVFSGILPPRFHSVRYMDGAYSDNLPTIDENTVTVSPFCGESDICPRDNSSQLFHVNWANTSIEVSKQNMNRFARILFPPRPEVLSNMCQQGFDDALRFLHRNSLISCTRCLSIQSTFVVEHSEEQHENFDPDCKECKTHRKEATYGNMPESVVSIIEAYIEQTNKGFLGWLMKRKSMRILKALSWPAFLPADIVYATLTKIMSLAPGITNSVWDMTKFLLETVYVSLAPDPYEIEEEERERYRSTQNLTISEFEEQSISQRLHSRRTSILDIDDHKHPPLVENLLTRRDSMRASRDNFSVQSMDVEYQSDTFENVLNASREHEALYAYYYMDDDHKMKVTKIYDLSENDGTDKESVNQPEDYDEVDNGSNIDAEETELMIAASTIREDSILLKQLSERDWKFKGLVIEAINADDDTGEDSPTSQSPNGSTSSMESYLKPEADQVNLISEEAATALNNNSPYSYEITPNTV